ncbi:RHS repeat-associated protein [Sphingomonas kyeonggiensis]|uniref:RHS repeat-associated protein n=2 Tax=Sphingomonas kyeonggiensis TaxID=1268553 RepID=A0A7W6JQ45_9SPHN|nr:RHS repeat-associated protein [Sphingomonas kyeonggiensis]
MMNRTTLTPRARRLSLLCASTILGAGQPVQAIAQTEPPVHVDVDENGVDFVSGGYVTTLTEGAIGSGEGQVAFTRTRNSGTGWFDEWTGGVALRTVGGVTTAYVLRGKVADPFAISGNTYTSLTGNGSTLVGTGAGYTYTTSDGTKIEFTSRGVGKLSGFYPVQGYACSGYSISCSIPTSITKPNGMKFSIKYDWVQKCTSGAGPSCTAGISYYRLASVASSAGYGFNVAYQTDIAGNYSAPQSPWYYRASVAFSNTNQPAASPPTITYLNPAEGYGDYTDPAGRTWRFTGTTSQLTGIQRPGAASYSTIISYSGTPAYVSSITIDGVTTNYSRVVVGSVATTTITDALSNQKIVEADLTKARVRKVTQVLASGNIVTQFDHDSSGRLTEVTYHEGNKVQYAYDARGNVTSTTLKAKPTVGGADIVTRAYYAPSCSNVVTCNSPIWTRDAGLNQTDYSYDPATGQLTSVTAPAAVLGGVRGQTRFSYSAISGVSMLTEVSACRTTSNCAGGSDEVKTAIAYNGNLLPTSVSNGSGDGSLTATQSMLYNSSGDLLSVDGALPGSADTTSYRYDAARNQIGVISADPDGAGPLPRSAQRLAFNSSDQATLIETGTVGGVSDADWAAFTPATQLAMTYDANGFKTVDSFAAGTNTYRVTQYSYDATGRLDCAALRMNIATWGTSPGACAVTAAGAFGPDRISRTVYDGAGRTTKLQEGYGTVDQADILINAYTGNGLVSSVTDGEGNKTSYEYDGFDRLTKTRFPIGAVGGGNSSTSDFEEIVYNNAGKIASKYLRGYYADSSKRIDFTYDLAGRLVRKHVADGSVEDVYYGYDLLGQQIYARFSSANGIGISNNYDALGRLVSTSNDMSGSPRTLSYVYDLAGNRVRITHPDGVYFASDYDGINRLSALKWWSSGSGTVPFMSIVYDTMGRRSGVTRSGSSTSYGYNAISRLSSLGQAFAGGVGNLNQTFDYNPVGQISGQSRDNDSYAYVGHYNVDRAYAVNSLNQIVAAGPASFVYDLRGNLTSDGSNSFNYDAENKLISKSGGVTLTYDPYGRIFSVTSAGGTSQFLYDGDRLVGEYNGSGLLTRRYMFAGRDEPVFADTGGMNCSGSTFFHNDERGSVIAQADCAGNRNGTNAYDEYGVPADGNFGRFQYTGQMWLPELGMYYYKARVYSPTLGRFMQADPAGYADGLNQYTYVGNDPVNFADPSGLLRAGCVFVTGSRIPDCSGRDTATGYVARKFSELTGSAQTAAIDAVAKYIVGDITLGSVVSTLVQEGAVVPCAGAWNCDEFAFKFVSDPGNKLNQNATFRKMAAAAWGKAIDEQVEVGFGGIGFDDFRPTTGLISSDAGKFISKEQIKAIADTGANVFFHTHQYMYGYPGFSGTDQQTCSMYGFFCVVYAGARGRGGDYGWYYYRNGRSKATN